LLASLVVLPKANRRWQAWLIFLPPIAIALGWQMFARLVGFRTSDAESVGLVFVSCAAGWAAFWLLGDRLAQCHGIVRFIAAAFLMTAFGSIGALASGLDDSEELLAISIAAGVFGSAVAFGTMLTGRTCRNPRGRGRFMVVLLAWTGLVVTLSLSCYLFVGSIVLGLPGPGLAEALSALAGASAIVTGIAYLVNLPFLLLAFNSPFYADRFRALFFPATAALGDLRYAPPLSTEPTAKPVVMADIVGSWRFYLDEASSTVVVEFHPDGTFAQNVLPNHGEVKSCPGGTWRLAGPMVHLDNYVTAKDALAQQLTWWMVDTSQGLALFGGETTPFRMLRDTPSPPPAD
jgi:hypothetical protein